MKRLKYTGAYTHLCSIIVIVILITGCQNVTNQTFEEDPELNFTSTEIDPMYDQHSMSLLSGVFAKGKVVEQGGYFASDAGNIDLSKALKVQELKDGTVRYTFRVLTNDLLVFENLIIRETKDGRVTSYVLRYQPDHTWLSENGGRFNLESFTGTLIARTTEGKNLMEVSFVNGKSTSFDAPTDKAKSMTENCEDGGDGSGSTGGGGGSTDGGDGGTDGGYDGGDGGYNGGSGSSGGSTSGGDDGGGGESDSNNGGSSGDTDNTCIWEINGETLDLCSPIELEEDPDVMTKTNTVCDPVDEVYDGECMDEYCEPDPVGIIIDPADLDPCESDDPPAYCENPCETGDPVLDDEAIQIGFEKMWEDSNYGTKSNPNDESQRKEQVGFIAPNDFGGYQFWRLSSSSITEEGPCGVSFIALLVLPEGTILVHTHPYSKGDIQEYCVPGETYKYDNKPGKEDRPTLNLFGLDKGIILDADKIIQFTTEESEQPILDDRCGY